MDIQVLRTLLERPIAFHPIFAKVSGSVKAGLFLSQLFYWSDKGSDPSGWIYKTQKEWKEETCLTIEEQMTAREALRKKELIEEKRAGNPARLFYRINFLKLSVSIETRIRESLNLESGKPLNKNQGTPVSLNTETTTKTTPEITNTQDSGRLMKRLYARYPGKPWKSDKQFYEKLERYAEQGQFEAMISCVEAYEEQTG